MPSFTSPAGFSLLSDKGVESAVPLTISSNAVTIGDMLELDVGAVAWTDADSSTIHWQLKAVATETVSSSATSVLAQLCTPGIIWVAELANNSSASHNGDRMILTDANTVNNTGTDSTAKEAVFIQHTVFGDASSKRAVGFIVAGTGINPAAS